MQQLFSSASTVLGWAARWPEDETTGNDLDLDSRVLRLQSKHVPAIDSAGGVVRGRASSASSIVHRGRPAPALPNADATPLRVRPCPPRRR